MRKMHEDEDDGHSFLPSWLQPAGIFICGVKEHPTKTILVLVPAPDWKRRRHLMQYYKRLSRVARALRFESETARASPFVGSVAGDLKTTGGFGC